MPSSVYSRRLLPSSIDRAVPAFILPRLGSPWAACFSTVPCRMATLGAAPKKGAKYVNQKRKVLAPQREADRQSRTEEVKALRKRIVLRNDNALEVRSLRDLDKKNVMTEENQGQMMGLPPETVDALRAVEAFKRTQGWSLFRRPAMLMRKEYIQLARLFQEVELPTSSNGKKTIRRIVCGDRMSGKSALVLHGLTIAFLRGWFVVNLPNARDLVNATTEYSPLPQSEPMQYMQTTYTSQLLQQILESNQLFLQSAKLTAKPDLPIPSSDKGTLKTLVELGIENQDASWPVFVALWKEISRPGRPPVLLAIDGLSNIMRNSDYMSANMKPIHAHDLTLVRHFVDHLSGQHRLVNGGIVLAATSATNASASPALRFSIQVAEARQRMASDIPQWNEHKLVDERVMEALKDLRSDGSGLDVLTVRGLSKEEARSIMEYYAESGMLRHQVNEGFVSEKWSLAGMGNIGELERAAVRARI